MSTNILITKMKKAQMQTGETIAIMVVVMILLIFALVFYGRVKAVDIEQKSKIFNEVDIVKLSQIAHSLPEIQCSFAQVADYGCLDALKVKYLSEMINHSFLGMRGPEEYFYYRELFGNSKITIEEINNTGEVTVWELYRTNGTGKSKRKIFMPTLMLNPATEKNSFAVMVIESYT